MNVENLIIEHFHTCREINKLVYHLKFTDTSEIKEKILRSIVSNLSDKQI